MRQELIESATGISYLLIVFVFASQVSFEPLQFEPEFKSFRIYKEIEVYPHLNGWQVTPTVK